MAQPLSAISFCYFWVAVLSFRHNYFLLLNDPTLLYQEHNSDYCCCCCYFLIVHSRSSVTYNWIQLSFNVRNTSDIGQLLSTQPGKTIIAPEISSGFYLGFFTCEKSLYNQSDLLTAVFTCGSISNQRHINAILSQGWQLGSCTMKKWALAPVEHR